MLMPWPPRGRLYIFSGRPIQRTVVVVVFSTERSRSLEPTMTPTETRRQLRRASRNRITLNGDRSSDEIVASLSLRAR